jgi:hypothetical protein
LYSVKHGFVKITDELVFSHLFSTAQIILDVIGRLFCSIFMCRFVRNVDSVFFAELTLLSIDGYG